MESAAPVPVEPGMNNTSAQRKHFAPTVRWPVAQPKLSSRPDAGTITFSPTSFPVLSTTFSSWVFSENLL